jgi:uncharacterized protein (TIGR03435 family)
MRLPAIATFLVITGSATSQTFGVAAIRQNLSGDGKTQIAMPEGGRLVVVNASLKTLIRNAWGLLGFQVTGGPAWLDNDKFDIQAKTGTTEKISQDNRQPLLQSLLADRFGLKFHWETREGQIYALIPDKTGHRFAEHTNAPGHGMNTSKGHGKARMRGINVPMSELASDLGNQLGRFATDQTGLPGHYDFLLEWDPDQAGDNSGPSLFTAVRDQLGLRLEPRKGPMQVLVIDSAEKPSAN